MKRLTWILVLPLAAVAVIFAVMNRTPVALDLWPLPWRIEAAAFLILLGSLAAGLVIGLLLALIVLAWFGDWRLSLVIGLALTINFTAAALGGVFVPVTVKRLGFDPALAGGVILTTVTDVMGFLSFLGLATLILLK